MDPVLLLDLILALVLLGRALYGMRTGLVVGFLSLVGMVAGGAAGFWAGPRLVSLLPALDVNRLARTVTIALVVMAGITLGEMIFGAVGRRLRGRDRERAHGLDAFAGFIAGAVVAALVCWTVLSAVRPLAPPRFASAISGSRVFQTVDGWVPDRFHGLPGRAVDAVLDQLPEVFGGDEPQLPVPEPDTDSIDNPGVQQAAAGIVQVRTDAPRCRSDASGTGWVVSPQRVVTNAHVVAGSEQVVVAVEGTGPELTAQVVAFDPGLDLAILAVPELGAAPLPRATDNRPAGDDAFAAGFPWSGPYSLSEARIRGTVIEQGTDIYGAPGVPREVYAIRGVVRPGNSGGPLLTGDGEVAGTVFAMSTVDPQTGYALTDAATAGWLDQAPALSAPVGTGGCLSG